MQKSLFVLMMYLGLGHLSIFGMQAKEYEQHQKVINEIGRLKQCEIDYKAAQLLCETLTKENALLKNSMRMMV